MQIILLQKLGRFGNLGDVANVAPGYGRYLLRYSKAMIATEENKKVFEERRKIIEKENSAKKTEAEKLATKLPNTITIIAQASEEGKLFGSISSRDIVDVLAQKHDVSLKVQQIIILHAIKFLGVHEVIINLHPEVHITIKVIVGRTESELANSLENDTQAAVETVENSIAS